MDVLNTPTAIVGQQVAGQEAETRKQLEQLVNTINSSAFDIGILAHTIKKLGLYSGYTTFQEYAKTLPIKLRKLQYLRRIAEVTETLNIPREQYEPLGIAKLREITSLDLDGQWCHPDSGEKTPLKDFVLGFLSKGKDMTLDEIKQHVKTLKGISGENDIVILHLGVTKSALDNTVRPALELAKMQLGSSHKDDEGVSVDHSDGKALEVIAVSFINDPANSVLAEG